MKKWMIFILLFGCVGVDERIKGEEGIWSYLPDDGLTGVIDIEVNKEGLEELFLLIRRIPLTEISEISEEGIKVGIGEYEDKTGFIAEIKTNLSVDDFIKELADIFESEIKEDKIDVKNIKRKDCFNCLHPFRLPIMLMEEG